MDMQISFLNQKSVCNYMLYRLNLCKIVHQKHSTISKSEILLKPYSNVFMYFEWVKMWIDLFVTNCSHVTSTDIPTCLRIEILVSLCAGQQRIS